MLCAVFVFACMDATAKWLARDYPVPMLVWVRYTGHLILMLVFLLPRLGRSLISTDHPRLQVARALMLFGVTSTTMAAFQRLPLTLSTSLLFITPILVALFSPWVLKERSGRVQGIAVVLGFGGMLLMLRPGGEADALGVVFALLGALCYTAYQLLTRKLAPTENALTMLFYTALTGTVLSSLLLPWLGSSIDPPLQDMALMLLLGTLGGTGHYLLIRAFSHAPANVLAPLVYLQLIWAGGLDYLLFGHVADLVSLAGMALISVAGIQVIRAEQRSGAGAPLAPDRDKAC